MITQILNKTKRCSKCKERKSISEFSKNCVNKDGLQRCCKNCMKQYYRNDKQAYIEKATKWAKKNPDRRKEISRTSAAKFRRTLKGCLFSRYNAIRQRCNNPKCLGYKWYGGRGIKLCFTFNEFLDYVINKLRINPKGLEIDRIDNNGNYELKNIRFVTHAENMKNTGR